MPFFFPGMYRPWQTVSDIGSSRKGRRGARPAGGKGQGQLGAMVGQGGPASRWHGGGGQPSY